MLKAFIIVAIGVLLWSNRDARQVTSDALRTAAEVLKPEHSEINEQKTLGERIDDILGNR
ncbi:hypothetical protein OMCYN_01858 [cyanobiont of Ornithocercus magnificus]|nr:hypothetical protein OMCYN_01858 [cyanobiont of Ornithocercus magnificus]